MSRENSKVFLIPYYGLKEGILVVSYAYGQVCKGLPTAAATQCQIVSVTLCSRFALSI